ncbi:MAG: hypothetical protein ABJE95_07270 [Byssovorax sp.]
MYLKRGSLAIVVLPFALGCSGAGESTSSAGGAGGVSVTAANASSGAGGGSSSGEAASTSASASSPAASSSSTGGGEFKFPPACVLKCQSPADCAVGATAGSPYDADNYTCTGGGCEYIGCHTDAECAVVYNDSKHVCRSGGGFPHPLCVLKCQSPADCGVGAPAGSTYDADNFACTGGACEPLGCHNDAECAVSLGNTNYTCASGPDVPYPYCALKCQVAADCVVAGTPPGGYPDADNYACTGGKCDFLGCHTTAECTASFMKADHVCQ